MLKISNKFQRLWSRLADKEYRDDYVDDAISNGLAVQIYNMREKRGWTQQQLADSTDTGQSAICRWENGDTPASITTLKRIASAFDVALDVRFVPFSEFTSESKPLDRDIVEFNNDGIRAIEPTSHYLAIGSIPHHTIEVSNDDYDFYSFSDSNESDLQEYIN